MIKEYNFTSEEEAYKEGKRLGAIEALTRLKVYLEVENNTHRKIGLKHSTEPRIVMGKIDANSETLEIINERLRELEGLGK